MVAKIKGNVGGANPEIEVSASCRDRFRGIKPVAIWRQAILERLWREGFLRHPDELIIIKIPKPLSNRGPKQNTGSNTGTVVRVDLPGQAELPTEQPTEAVSAPPEAPAPAEPPAPPPQQNSRRTIATEALHRQIEALKKSEQVQRQQAAMPQQPMSREQRLAAVAAAGGLSNDEIQFFQKHPEMVDHPQITGLAVNQAKQAGHERGTDAHLAFVEKAFNAHVEHLMREQAQAQPAMQTPAFFNHHRHDQRRTRRALSLPPSRARFRRIRLATEGESYAYTYGG